MGNSLATRMSMKHNATHTYINYIYIDRTIIKVVMTCRSLLRHCKTGLDIWVFREMGYTHVYPPHCQCNRENDDKLLGLGVVYVQTNPRQWKNACNPLPPCPSVDGHQPCSPTCLGKNLGGWNITNGFIFPARSVQEISKPHHLHHHGVWKTHQHHPFEMNPQHANGTCSIQHCQDWSY